MSTETIIKLRVRNLAEAKGIGGAAALATFLGISRSMADRLWVGTPFPNLKNSVAYAEKFGVSVDDLYERTDLPSRRKRSQKNGRKAGT